MPKRKRPAKDKQLQEFLKGGGRNNAEADFDTILKRAAKSAQPKKTEN